MYEVKATVIYPSGKEKLLKVYYIPTGIGTTSYFKEKVLKELHEELVKTIGRSVGCKIIGFKKMKYDVLINEK